MDKKETGNGDTKCVLDKETWIRKCEMRNVAAKDPVLELDREGR
jgi:hypothetical protein